MRASSASVLGWAIRCTSLQKRRVSRFCISYSKSMSDGSVIRLSVSEIIIYRAADAKRGGGRGPPHGVVDVVFGGWLPTFERPGGGREGVRSQDRRYRSGRRRTRADRELRGLRPR